jgi:peptidoglycan/LPS O-acetylase OafA/YrhL
MVRFFQDSFKRKVSGVYYPGIDALRFVSIFYVLIAHITVAYYSYFNKSEDLLLKIMENGSNGVRIFFSISGFVIWGALTRIDINRRTYYNFVVRRFYRLEPSYLFIVAVIYLYMFLMRHFEPIDFLHMLAGFFMFMVLSSMSL